MSTIERAIDKLKHSGDRAEGPDKPVEEGIAKQEEAAKAVESDTPALGDPASSDSQAPAKASGDPEAVVWDISRLEEAGLIVKDAGKTTLSEEYRLIKRPLLINAFSSGAAAIENGNLIMVTSALPGEGKTFTSINLAMSIALERDKTVLLVDADVARPVISGFFGNQAQIGLVDYLLNDEMKLSDVLVHTNIPNLRILPAGRRHPHSTELLASDNMHRLTQELASRYPDRIVIFDSPPLLATTEAVVLAGLMGQIVVVVEAERTTREVVQDAVDLLGPNAVTSLVLNKSHKALGTPYYDYYNYHAGAKK